MTSSDDVLNRLADDGILTVVPCDELIDDLVERLGGECAFRTGDAKPYITTTYRWLNDGAGALNAELVQRLARAAGRHVGEIGGHGPKFLILISLLDTVELRIMRSGGCA